MTQETSYRAAVARAEAARAQLRQSAHDAGARIAPARLKQDVKAKISGAVKNSVARVGDKARVCVHDLPKDCPADDLRGIGYRVLDLRTRRRWVMGNWHHICRGA